MGIDKFSAALDLLTGFNVNLYVGEDVFKGKLLGVETDHVVLETENKYIFYYNIDKIQAITKNTKQFQPVKTTAQFQKTQSLTELLQSFQHSWVTILSINKQKFSGVLSEIDADFATLINGEERILIKLTHVSNILKGFIKEEEEKKQEEKAKSENKSESKENKKEEKDEESKGCETKEYTAEVSTEMKSMQITKPVKNQGKSEKQPDVMVKEEVVEANKNMIWSQPIKSEVPVTRTKEHYSSRKKDEFVGDLSPKAKFDIKKPTNEMNQKEKLIDDGILSKPTQIEPQKETKSGKGFTMNKDTKSPAFLPFKNQEAKTSKFHEADHATKSVSHHSSSKKAESVQKESYTNDTKKVWKQKDHETRAFRFAGEPVSREKERSFPFAGWPNNSKRTFRF